MDHDALLNEPMDHYSSSQLSSIQSVPNISSHMALLPIVSSRYPHSHQQNDSEMLFNSLLMVGQITDQTNEICAKILSNHSNIPGLREQNMPEGRNMVAACQLLFISLCFIPNGTPYSSSPV
jgi:hypothetical protein